MCDIVPPYVLKAIVAEGTKKQKEWAMRTLMISEKIRGRREVVGSIMPTMMSAVFIPAKERIVYNAHNSSIRSRATVARSEGQRKSKDVAVNEAYDYSGNVYDFYHDVFKRNSIDDRGMQLISYVHWRRNWQNAQWDGVAMYYGDGDGEILQRFTIALDVIAHEMSHGVTQYESDLEYHDQPGALNESVSDVMGSLVKQYISKQKVDEADWLIGKGIFVDKKIALRNMKSPGSANPWDIQPGHMDDYKRMPEDEDNGGVHVNSGIPNRAFYLAATQIGGFAWKQAGLIWYKTLSSGLRTDATFEEFATATFVMAGDLFGADSSEQKAVLSAWEKVGVKVHERGLTAKYALLRKGK
jgi:Zn-dependent metalloprotease